MKNPDVVSVPVASLNMTAQLICAWCSAIERKPEDPARIQLALKELRKLADSIEEMAGK